MIGFVARIEYDRVFWGWKGIRRKCGGCPENLYIGVGYKTCRCKNQVFFGSLLAASGVLFCGMLTDGAGGKRQRIDAALSYGRS